MLALCVDNKSMAGVALNRKERRMELEIDVLGGLWLAINNHIAVPCHEKARVKWFQKNRALTEALGAAGKVLNNADWFRRHARG